MHFHNYCFILQKHLNRYFFFQTLSLARYLGNCSLHIIFTFILYSPLCVAIYCSALSYISLHCTYLCCAAGTAHQCILLYITQTLKTTRGGDYIYISSVAALWLPPLVKNGPEKLKKVKRVEIKFYVFSC